MRPQTPNSVTWQPKSGRCSDPGNGPPDCLYRIDHRTLRRMTIPQQPAKSVRLDATLQGSTGMNVCVEPRETEKLTGLREMIDGTSGAARSAAALVIEAGFHRPHRFRPAIIALEFARATGIKHRSRLIAVPVCGPGCAPRCSAAGTTRSGPSRPCAAARAPPTLPPRRRARPRRPPCFSRLRANPPHTVLLRTPFPVPRSRVPDL